MNGVDPTSSGQSPPRDLDHHDIKIVNKFFRVFFQSTYVTPLKGALVKLGFTIVTITNIGHANV